MNRIIKIFGYQFYVKEFLVVFFTYLMMENVFSWLVLPNSVILLSFEKGLSVLIFAYVLYHFTSLETNEKIYIGLFTFLMLRLVGESLFDYGTFFQQFTLFTVLFPVVYTIFIKCVARSLDLDFLEFLAKFYLVIYVAMMVIYGRGFSFSLESVDMDDYGPFSGDSRIIHARSIFMMIIPFLWYLNRFIQTFNKKYLMIFAFCFIVILIHQHRSVWASTIVATLIYFFALIRNRVVAVPKIFGLALTGLIILMVVGIIAANVAPKSVDFFADRFSEILEPTREGGTGEFREMQRLTYLALAVKKPIFGWTFEGFYMPNPLVDWWPEGSGQHFHEGYVEMLFYHGLAGFLLKYWFLFYLGFKAFSKKLSAESIILIAFSVAGLVFSFSYVLPLVFWGHVGLCLYYLEKDRAPKVPEPEEEITAEEEPVEELAKY